MCISKEEKIEESNMQFCIYTGHLRTFHISILKTVHLKQQRTFVSFELRACYLIKSCFLLLSERGHFMPQAL